MRVRMSRRAETDLIEITDFIALDNPERATQFEDELLERAQKISTAPLGYVLHLSVLRTHNASFQRARLCERRLETFVRFQFSSPDA